MPSSASTLNISHRCDTGASSLRSELITVDWKQARRIRLTQPVREFLKSSASKPNDSGRGSGSGPAGQARLGSAQPPPPLPTAESRRRVLLSAAPPVNPELSTRPPHPYKSGRLCFTSGDASAGLMSALLKVLRCRWDALWKLTRHACSVGGHFM